MGKRKLCCLSLLFLTSCSVTSSSSYKKTIKLKGIYRVESVYRELKTPVVENENNTIKKIIFPSIGDVVIFGIDDNLTILNTSESTYYTLKFHTASFSYHENYEYNLLEIKKGKNISAFWFEVKGNSVYIQQWDKKNNFPHLGSKVVHLTKFERGDISPLSSNIFLNLNTSDSSP